MPRKFASEEDPLLPHNEAAPEIFTTQRSANSDSAEVRYSGFSSSHDEISDLTPTYQTGHEISDYRSHSSVKHDFQSYGSTPQHESGLDRDGRDSTDPAAPSATKRAMNTIVSLFTMVVFFSIVAMFLNGDDLGAGPPGSSPSIPVPSHGHGHTSSSSPPQPSWQPQKPIEERVHAILTSTPLLDGHNDLAIFIRGGYANNITSSAFREDFEKGPMPGNVDLPRLRKGMVGGGFWSAFVTCPVPSYRTKAERTAEGESEVGDDWEFFDEDYSVPVSHTLQQIDLLKRLQRQYPDDFTPAGPDNMYDSSGSTREAMFKAWRESGGRKLFGTLSIEGLHQLPPSSPLASLRMLYNLGVRAATLTWNCHNAFADAALIWNGFDKRGEVVDTKRVRGGLTKRGRQVIREMNRLGMLVDVSHTSYHTQLAVLGYKHDESDAEEDSGTRDEFEGASIAPVIFSHSSAYAICPHPRNVRNDVLRQVKRTGSLVMVNFSPDFVSCVAPKLSSSDAPHSAKDHEIKLPDFYEKNNTLHQVARHIVYIGNRIGYDYVGLGSDFDGMGENPPRGLDGVDKYPDLVAELLRMGVTDKQAQGIVGGNLLRVWEEVDRVSMEMRKNGEEEGVDEATGW